MGQTWDGNVGHDIGNVVSDIGGWFSGPPGDPGRIRQCATQVDGLRDRLDCERRALNGAVDELTTTWTGAAAGAFHSGWYAGGSGQAPAAVLDGAYHTLDRFARQLYDYADRLQHAQEEHWISMGIMAALTIVNAVQLGADPATDAAQVGVATGTAVGTSFALADIGTMAINGAATAFATDVVSQFGADLLDELNPEFDRTGDHAVSLFSGQELLTSTVAGGVTGALLGGGRLAFGRMGSSEATAAADAEATPALRIYAAQGRVDAAERAGVLNPGASGKVFATDGQYEYGNIAQSNLAISARGENVAGYWQVPDSYAAEFTYVGRVEPIDLWEGGGREFTRDGPIPYVDLGRFQPIRWAAAT